MRGVVIETTAVLSSSIFYSTLNGIYYYSSWRGSTRQGDDFEAVSGRGNMITAYGPGDGYPDRTPPIAATARVSYAAARDVSILRGPQTPDDAGQSICTSGPLQTRITQQRHCRVPYQGRTPGKAAEAARGWLVDSVWKATIRRRSRKIQAPSHLQNAMK